MAFEAIRAKVSGILNEDDVKRLAEKFIEPSFGDRARFYTTMRGWDLEIDIEIRQLYSLRNQAVHGDPVVIGAQEARRAHEICAKSLKAELGVTEEFLWEHEPKLLGLSIEYELLRSAT